MAVCRTEGLFAADLRGHRGGVFARRESQEHQNQRNVPRTYPKTIFHLALNN